MSSKDTTAWWLITTSPVPAVAGSLFFPASLVYAGAHSGDWSPWVLWPVVLLIAVVAGMYLASLITLWRHPELRRAPFRTRSTPGRARRIHHGAVAAGAVLAVVGVALWLTGRTVPGMSLGVTGVFVALAADTDLTER